MQNEVIYRQKWEAFVDKVIREDHLTTGKDGTRKKFDRTTVDLRDITQLEEILSKLQLKDSCDPERELKGKDASDGASNTGTTRDQADDGVSNTMLQELDR